MVILGVLMEENKVNSYSNQLKFGQVCKFGVLWSISLVEFGFLLAVLYSDFEAYGLT